MSIIFLTIIAFIVTIGFLVLIHEGGHFAAARLFGVWVHQFAIGMGPALWRRKGRETEYSIRIFPIGGYVRMAGEDRESTEDQAVPKERLFTSKPAWQRMIIVFAGPVMNIIAAVLLMIAVIGILGIPYLEVTELVNLPDGYPSPSLGVLQVGDKIESMNARPVYSIAQLLEVINNSKGQPIHVQVRRGERLLDIAITPFWSEQEKRYMIGINLRPRIQFNTILMAALGGIISTTNRIAKLSPDTFLARQGLQAGDRVISVNGIPVHSFWQVYDLVINSESVTLVIERRGQIIHLPEFRVAGYTPEEIWPAQKIEPELWLRKPAIWDATVLALQRSLGLVAGIIKFLEGLILNLISGDLQAAKKASEGISGPIGIGQILREAVEAGLIVLLPVIAVISLNLGLFNLLPFPALDGSRIVFLLIEMIRRKPIPPEKEGLIHYIGFLVLIGLILLVTYNDIMRFFGK